MIRYIREYKLQITLFLFLLIPIVALDSNQRNPRDFRVYDRIILGVTAPIQSFIHWTLDSSISFVNRYLFLVSTYEDNQGLHRENRRLQAQINQLRETTRENERLRKLLQFKETRKIDTIVARVIALDASQEFRSIRINRGASDGIQKDMAVVSVDGAVGRVFRVTHKTADILTIMDPLSGIDAIDERSRARGVLQGLTDEVCALKYTLRMDDIQVGDLLVTSGLAGIFPKGIPLGLVSKVERQKYGINQDIEVRPAVDFSKLEEVLVVTQFEGKEDLLKEMRSPPKKESTP